MRLSVLSRCCLRFGGIGEQRMDLIHMKNNILYMTLSKSLELKSSSPLGQAYGLLVYDRIL